MLSERIQVSLQRRLRRCLRQAFEATATATAAHGGIGFPSGKRGQIRFPAETDLTPEATRLLLLLFFLQSGVDAHGKCPWPGGWVAQGREPHGLEACLGRVGQDAQPRSCRVRRTVHTSKRRPSLQGRTCSVPCAAHPPGQPAVAKRSPRPPRGASPLADIQMPRKRKRPGAGPGRVRGSGQAGIRTPASLRRPVRWPSGDHPPCGGPAGQPGPGQPVQRRAGPVR